VQPTRIINSVPFEVFPELILREFKSIGEGDYSKIFDALNKMSMRSVGMLYIQYEWHEDSEEILAPPMRIEGREVAEALRTGKMHSPVSGNLVPDFSDHIHVIYMARTDNDPYQMVEEWV
jgi:hypothetical protein